MRILLPSSEKKATNRIELFNLYVCVCLSLVLQGSKGLVAVWLLFLCTTLLHRCLLYNDDV